ncbi:MAG: TolC family protein [Deltaproteobacteria bacterium]|nr:TolC family protein [Deltaproteobacteria bacterium]
MTRFKALSKHSRTPSRDAVCVADYASGCRPWLAIGLTPLGRSTLPLGLVVFALFSCTPALPRINAKEATARTHVDPWKPSATTDELARDEQTRQADDSASSLPARADESRLSLSRAVDLALSNDPRTRATWLRARAAAARLGQSKSAYYPEITIGATGSYAHQTALGGRYSYTQGSAGPSLNMSYLLFDFGARVSRADAELAALIGANWTHTAAIQERLLSVANAYYQYESAQAMVEAAEASVASAQLSYSAASARKLAGTVDLGDVLRAETALLQARLGLQEAQGRADVLKGTLASELGLRIDSSIEVMPLPDRIHAEDTVERVGALLSRALERRPDLLAARASAAAAWQRVRAARRDSLPTLTLGANANLSFYFPQQSKAYGESYGANLAFNYPIFSGFSHSYDEQRASWEALAAEADAQTLQEQIAVQVWTAFHQLSTVREKLEQTRALLETSERLERFYRERYQAGVGTVLDLMLAQETLAAARSRHVQARADYLMALIALSHGVGELERRSMGEFGVGTVPGKRTERSQTSPTVKGEARPAQPKQAARSKGPPLSAVEPEPEAR